MGGTAAMSMLVAVFAVAGGQQLLAWMRNRAACDYLWSGTACLAAAAAATMQAFGPLPGAPLDARWQAVLMTALPASAWLVSGAWFAVHCASGDARRRRVAASVCVLVAALLLAETAWHGQHDAGAPSQMHAALRIGGSVAALVAAGLAFEGAARLWRAASAASAVTLATFGAVMCLHAWQSPQLTGEVPALSPPVLLAFLAVVLMISAQFAVSLASAEILLQRQRQELAHASRLSVVGELTATIAHEINQPLSAIVSNGDAAEILLGRTDPPLDEVRRIIADMRRDGMRASEVIRHVRTLVRKRELTLEKLDANAVASEVVAFLDPEFRRRRIALAIEPAPQPAWVRAEGALIRQVLVNLLMNAMDAVEAVPADGLAPPARGVVVGVSTTAHGEREIRVVDQGAGVPPQRLPRLFDSFYTSKPHGLGLGLSIARSIVEAHGGRIRAQNNRGAGTTFNVTLPPYDERHG